MLNSVSLVGRLTDDPNLRYTSTGKAVANFRLAIQRPFKNQNGDYEADFINCVVWNKQAENLAQYMNKGSTIAVSGSLQSRSYENQNGQKVYVTEVLVNNVSFIQSKKNNNQNNGYQNNQNVWPEQGSQLQDQQKNGGQLEPYDISDDDLPF